MALYISAGRRRRATIVAAVAAAVVGLAVGLLIGRGTATTVDDRIAEAQTAGRRLAASLRVLPLEYEQATTGVGEDGGAADLVRRALDGEQAALDTAPWLGDRQIAELEQRLAVVRDAPAAGLTPDEFSVAVEEAATAVETTFGVATTSESG